MGRMLNTASTPKEPRTSTGSAGSACVLPEVRRHPIRHPDDYGIPLPDWLRECIANVPPGIGQSCPTDPDARLTEIHHMVPLIAPSHIIDSLDLVGGHGDSSPQFKV